MAAGGRSRRQRHPVGAAEPETSAPAVSRVGYRLALVALLVTVVVAAVSTYLLSRPSQRDEVRQQAAANPTAAEQPPEPGAGDDCRQFPPYALSQGFSGEVFISTDMGGRRGLVLAGRDSRGAQKIYQHDSWDDAGHLGAYAYDRNGNIFVSPSPLVSLYENPPEAQNRIWRVDVAGGEMTPFVDLPPAAPPGTHNPFGVLGLAYDCDTESLYATSVMGSTVDRESGRLFRIDLATGGVEVLLEGRDYFGVATYRGADGRRIYLGSARDSGVYSATLDAGGGIVGELRTEFYLSNFPGGANDRVKRLRFPEPGSMRIRGFDFNYTLKVSSALPHSEYDLSLDPGDGSWKPVRIRRNLSR